MKDLWKAGLIVARLHISFLRAIKPGLDLFPDLDPSLMDEQGQESMSLLSINGKNKPSKTLMLFDRSGPVESGTGNKYWPSPLALVDQIKDEDPNYEPASKKQKLDLNLSLGLPVWDWVHGDSSNLQPGSSSSQPQKLLPNE
ncbi:hypothetical protein PGTUg99_017430 [Puccinia graminis f. sp. tritici]|uniref:Uncharacterized protein n=1 Tax=Puccinia graminis f. sp. tritici TaxID=56615 RepID=A0A5B0LJL2_PUCGR|nr:hypothetical protein PGTUg99_017430 [Puccinia graminis f. sp. tritici]